MLEGISAINYIHGAIKYEGPTRKSSNVPVKLRFQHYSTQRLLQAYQAALNQKLFLRSSRNALKQKDIMQLLFLYRDIHY